MNISNNTSQEPEKRKLAMTALCSKMLRATLNGQNLTTYEDVFEKEGDFGQRIKSLANSLIEMNIEKAVAEAEQLSGIFSIGEYFKRFKDINNAITGRYMLSPISVLLDYFYSPSGMILSENVTDITVKAISSLNKTQYDATDCMILNQFLNIHEEEDLTDKYILEYIQSKWILKEDLSVDDSAYLMMYSQIVLKNSLANKYMDDSLDFYKVSLPSIAAELFTDYKVLNLTKKSLEYFVYLISPYSNMIIENIPNGHLKTQEEIIYNEHVIKDILAVKSNDKISLDYTIEGRRRVITIDLENLLCSAAYMLFSDILIFIAILQFHDVYTSTTFRQRRDMYKIVGVNASGLDYDRREEIQDLFD